MIHLFKEEKEQKENLVPRKSRNQNKNQNQNLNQSQNKNQKHCKVV